MEPLPFKPPQRPHMNMQKYIRNPKPKTLIKNPLFQLRSLLIDIPYRLTRFRTLQGTLTGALGNP